LQCCENVLLRLYTHPLSTPFQHPVTVDEAPDYHEKIMHPVDLSYVKAKLRRKAQVV
jgi:hypothetical protein